MIVKDINQHLRPPSPHYLYSVNAAGAFIRLEYHATLPSSINPPPPLPPMKTHSTVVVYLNDTGREVLRTEDIRLIEEPVVVSTRKQTFWIRLYLTYIEVRKCLKRL